MSFQSMERRTLKCPVCGRIEREEYFGIGFPDWLRLMDIFDPDKAKIGEIPNPVICPNCKKILLDWLNGGGNKNLLNSQPKSNKKKEGEK